MGALGYYGVELFLKKISIFHVAPTGQREQHPELAKLNVSRSCNFLNAQEGVGKHFKNET